ncbi:hypothetical protein [Acidiplasma sp.]|uniref:SLAC1 family transporter n=1 Tax=Acidiplasma sp. TaxID=1872114 RepID=UPI002585E678|nr:hypothetical protein [Acidiplasma sp.]
MKFKGLGPEWFPVVLGTLSISLALYINYLVFLNLWLFNAGKIIFFLVIAMFIFVLISVVYRYASNSGTLKMDYNNPTALSFLAFLGIIMYALAFFYSAYIGINRIVAATFLYIYFIFYVYVIIINLLLNYNLYTNKYNSSEFSYAMLVPSIVIGGNIILSSIMLIKPLESYYTLSELKLIYFMIFVSLGITFFQFLFVGITAFIYHINKTEYLRSVPAAMIPVGASSMIIINIMFLPYFNYLHLFNVPDYMAVDSSMLFFGFDTFLFLISGIIAAGHIKRRQSMTVWAYVFPVGISTFSDYMIYSYTGIFIFKYAIVIFTIVLIILYIYSWINTYLIIKNPGV